MIAEYENFMIGAGLDFTTSSFNFWVTACATYLVDPNDASTEYHACMEKRHTEKTNETEAIWFGAYAYCRTLNKDDLRAQVRFVAAQIRFFRNSRN